MIQYSYTYKQGRELTEAEIQQAGAAQAELEAAKKAVVNFWLDENTGEVLTFCQGCSEILPVCPGDTFTYIDKAGDWDICDGCGAQNIPGDCHN